MHPITNVRFFHRQGPVLLDSATGTLRDIQQPQVEIFTSVRPLSMVERLGVVAQIAHCIKRLHEEGNTHGSPSPGCLSCHEVPSKGSRSSITITLKNAGLYYALSTSEDFVKVSEPTRYMAPEYLSMDHDFVPTKEGDIYGWALLSYTILCGEPLFPDWPHPKCVSLAASQNLIARIVRPADVPDYVWELLCECWNSVPNARPSIAEVVNRLQVPAV
ncbi:kinase-like domain-containing protein [Cyathus striatus]|nr:kinase-like domain-containing protein [Cyathus striatus]